MPLRSWLPKVIPDLSFFHSEDIPKGKNWHTALVDGLRECPLGIFCITPESLRSPWLMFEAGALAQHGDEPTLLTYTLAAVSLDGPLSHFQATKFERADSRRFVQDLGAILGIENRESVLRRFDESWEDFESEARKTTHVGLEELAPGFFSLFHNKKTFHEELLAALDRYRFSIGTTRRSSLFKHIIAGPSGPLGFITNLTRQSFNSHAPRRSPAIKADSQDASTTKARARRDCPFHDSHDNAPPDRPGQAANWRPRPPCRSIPISRRSNNAQSSAPEPAGHCTQNAWRSSCGDATGARERRMGEPSARVHLCLWWFLSAL